MFKRYVLFLFAFFACQAMAQENIPETSDIQVESVTAEVLKNQKSQTLLLRISGNTAQAEFLNIALSGFEHSLAPVAVSLNGEELWLIQGEAANPNNTVLAWNETGQPPVLQLYPGDWAVPYVLDLELQLSFEKFNAPDSLAQTAVQVVSELGGSRVSAAATGRGKNLTIK